jgi:hypothetical protein
MFTPMLILRRIKIEWDRRTDDDASNNPTRVGGMRSHPQHRATIGTYPSGQRCCAASASHSGRTKGATLVLARLGNAAAQLVLRTQPRRKALRS